MAKSSSELIFEALCKRFQSDANSHGLTREELEEATGLPRATLEAALNALHPPGQNLRIAYEGDRVTLGVKWRTECEGGR